MPLSATQTYAENYTENRPPVPWVPRQDTDFGDNGIAYTQQGDKIRTSDTYYRTVAIEVSRCYPGTEIPTGEKVVVALENGYSFSSRGNEYNSFGFSYEDFCAKASPDWVAEYNAYAFGDAVGEYTLKFDCRMVVYEHGILVQDAPGVPHIFTDFDSIANYEAWADKTGLKSHYDLYIKVRKTLEAQNKLKKAMLEAPEDKTIEGIGDGSGGGLDIYDYQYQHDATAPIEYHEGNSSPDGIDIGTGIPTTEKLHNEYDATSWYAETDVRMRVKFWDDYHSDVEYKFNWWDGHSYHKKPDGHGGWEDDLNSPIINVGDWKKGKVDFCSPCHFGVGVQDWQMIPIVGYEYLANTLGLDFSDAEVKNKTFENGVIKYSSNITVTGKAMSTNNYVDAGAPGMPQKDWYSVPSTDDTVNAYWHGTDGAHIILNGTLPKVEEYTKDGEIWVAPKNGLPYFVGSSEETCGGIERSEEVHLGLRQDCRSAIEAVISTRNDSLEITASNSGTHVYMKNDEVHGVNFLKEDEKKEDYSQYTKKTASLSNSAAMQMGYGNFELLSGTDTGKDKGEQDTTIPANVDNGDYETGFLVNYKRFIVNDGGSWSASCDTEGEEYGLGGGLVPEHCIDKGNSRPGWVFIHTPIISLFNVISSTPNNDGRIPLSDKAVHDNLQLVSDQINLGKTSDGRDVAQMRLDNYYILDFIQTDHLNKTGYGPSETTDPVANKYGEHEKYSKYDKYTLNKWVKFPFAVEYDGKLYPKNYWILVKSPGSSASNIAGEAGYKKAANLTAGTKASDWYPTSDNHWRKMPFYIPSYAEEVGGPGRDAKIKILVEAINVNGKFGGEHNGPEYKKGGPTSDIILNDDGTITIDESQSVYADPNDKLTDSWGDIVDSDKYVTWVLKEQNVANNEDFTAGTTTMYGEVDGNAATTESEAVEMENLWEQNKNIAQDKYADYPKGAHYCCISELQCQTSGIIYGFTIVGSSDKDTFNPQHSRQLETDSVPFCPFKEEKTVGDKNRLGESAMRFHSDGDIARDASGNLIWPKYNTLVLTKGKSKDLPEAGTVIKGSRFSFLLKTIANLWDDTIDTGTKDLKGDYIKIVPTFRYYREDVPDGDYSHGVFTEVPMDKLKVYYDSPTSPDKFVEYGSDIDTADRNLQKVKLAHKQFEDSYYGADQEFIASVKNNSKAKKNPQHLKFGDWVKYTVKNYNSAHATVGTGNQMTEQEYLNTEHYSYNLSHITLNSGLRFLSGENEELMRNIKGNGNEWHSLRTYQDGSDNGKVPGVDNYNSTNSRFEFNHEARFRHSMQTWYGQYYIPNNLYIIDLTKHPEMEHKTLEEYAKEKGGITKDDPIFEDNTGYLVINFSILSYNNGEPHLQYGGKNVGEKVRSASETMWEKEGFEYVIPSPDVDSPVKITDTIELQDGDIAVIDLSKAVSDKYTAAIFNIN